MLVVDCTQSLLYTQVYKMVASLNNRVHTYRQLDYLLLCKYYSDHTVTVRRDYFVQVKFLKTKFEMLNSKVADMA